MKYSQLIENNNHQYLYHATYKPYLKTIMTNGLGGDNLQKNWTDSKHNVVYLATDPNIAYDFAETSELIDNDELLDQIIVLKIDTKLLDKNKLKQDTNIILDKDETPYSFEYNGIIPSSAITVL